MIIDITTIIIQSLLIGIGAFFVLVGMINILPTKSKSSSVAVKGVVQVCQPLQNGLNNEKFMIEVEFVLNGQKLLKTFPYPKSKSIGDYVRFNVTPDGSSIVEKERTKFTGKQIGGIFGLVIGTILVIMGALKFF